MLIPLSTVVLVLIFMGIINHRNRRLHLSLMSAAFIIDLGLVLYIEFTRAAIEQAVEGVHGLLLFHIIVSVLTLVLYVVLISLGVKWFKGENQVAALHRNLAYVFTVCRLTNYVTSFFIAA